MIRFSAAVVLIVALAAFPLAQQPIPQRAPGTLTEGVTAVLVDVVVRDRRGQPVRDLSPSDFEILEDGVPQTLGSFSPVFDGATAAAAEMSARAPRPGASAPTATPPSADPGVIVTALVFDRLTPEAQRLAVQAAQSYLGTQEQTPHHVGIYGVDLALTPYTAFTRNAPLLRKGLDALATRASSGFNQPEQQQRRADAERRAGSVGDGSATPPVAGGGPGGGAAAGAAAAAGVEAMLAQMEARMLREFDAMERDQQGYSTTNGLLAVIGALGQLPGRKSLVLFSEGIAIPPAVQRLFLGVIDAANRANVSIYTIDAAGLRAESEQAKIAAQVNRTAARGINTGYADAAGGPLTRALEGNEDALRQDPEGALGQLAQFTGGLLFNNTNNLRQGLTRIDDDLRNYYLLGYTPSNQQTDGRFRAIDVRVKRSGVTVAARKGYFAVPDAGGGPVSTWEAPALGALAQKPVPNAFPVRAGALRFPERGRPGLTPVVIDFLTESIEFRAAADGEIYTSDFAVLVRFLDDQNQVVRRVSQHYEVNGPLDQMEGARRGAVIFYREPELPPGTYTMETVVYDALADRASVRFSTVEIPRTADGTLRMSSLVLVQGADQVPEADRRADNPLQLNDVVLRPNLGEPIPRSSKEALFYFTVYPEAAGPAPQAVIEILQNGRRVAQVPMPVGPADASGRVQQLGRLPLADFAPGTYQLQVTVKQGTEQVSEAAVFRVVE